MNQLRKKAKLKTKKEDISTPTDLKHLKHIGPHELAVNLPETCYETDWRQDQVWFEPWHVISFNVAF